MKPILQTEIAECVLACVGMVASLYGLVSDLASLRNQFRISSQGSNLKRLMDISAKMNMAGRSSHLQSRGNQEGPDSNTMPSAPCALH